MKRLLFISLILTCKAWAQDNITDQLKRLCSEAASGFEAFKGDLKKISKGDTIYHSTFVLEGTSNTEIEKSRDNNYWIFSCTIDSSSVKGARKSVQHWKRKLQSSLDKSFQVKEIDEKYYSGEARGYKFIGSKAKIMLFQTILNRKGAFSKVYIIVSSNTDKQ